MRPLQSVRLLFLLLALSGRGAAAETGFIQPAFSSNDLVITCAKGFEWMGSAVVFRGDVHVFDPRMYLECELLTAVLTKTNQAASAQSAGLTNLSGHFDIDTIIAETNVLMMGRNLTAIGDRAVYTASNEVVVLTGTLVVIETDRSYSYGTNFVINRVTGEGYAVGPTTVQLKVNPATRGTNILKPGLGVGGERKTKSPAHNPKDPAGPQRAPAPP